jgi:hydrogenase nickel incorporation protein HypA/HybF
MHELALMEDLVRAVTEQVDSARVHVVRLEVGRLSCVVPDALRFCFDVCARGTSLEGAVLEIREIGGRATCHACGETRDVEGPLLLCPCGSADLTVVAGQELRVREVEVT